ncbi:colicin-like pore-forming protein [Serratia plymuthica]|uniref:colicin-like pore-forming protein n=1 Tax=Serratia plymuthica TaxID=82996 RepID=UPI00045661B7|nr:colicin-like pore-forming protein [Serratia plymuthica]AHY06380.1 colicin-B [Serratia plymuthica]
MSGGDGKDARGPTGGVNGGPTGLGGGPNVGHGGTLTDTINGVTMTFEGVHAIDSGSGIQWGGGDSGKGNNGGSKSGASGRNALRSIPGHPNVVDGGQLTGDNRDKHLYYSRTENFVYSVSIDRNGNEKGTFQVSRPKTNESDTRTSWAKGEEYRKSVAREQVRNYLNDEKNVLMEASGIIADAGEKISNHISGQYKRYAGEIANNLRNFQGKTIRNYNDALASLNNIMSNPSMKVKQGDKQALISAMKSVKASDLASRFGHFGKFFKAADLAIKADKIRDKAIEGYNTGNWAPLAYEIEAMVLSGIVGAVALGLVTGILSLLALSALFTAAITIAAVALIAYATSYIDAALAERFNNEVVRPTN